jgi:Spy/CpxP family protein refolding chaperone
MRRIRFAFADHRRTFHQLDPTQADYQEKLQGIANEVSKLSGQMVMTFGETYAKVAALLTPEQREQLQQTFQKHHRRPQRGDH